VEFVKKVDAVHPRKVCEKPPGLNCDLHNALFLFAREKKRNPVETLCTKQAEWIRIKLKISMKRVY
jgi:hypothetical protein